MAFVDGGGGEMKNSVWICLLGVCAGVPAAAEDRVKLSPTPIELPGRIGPLLHEGEPHEFDQPQLGVSYKYNGNGLALTIYVYDLGVENIPDGGDTNITCQVFEQSKAEIAGAGYAGLVLKNEQLVKVTPDADSPLVREAAFEFVLEGRPAISYLWITGVAKHFIKLRFSLDASMRDETADARAAVLTALGEAIKPHLLAVDPKAEKPGASIGLNFSDSTADMATGMMNAGLLAAVTDKAPDAVPVCGGAFVPGYAMELDIFESLFGADSEPDSKSSKRLAATAKAGFLDEFVRAERHRESWGDTPPAGLDLAGYAQWKKKNLKGFRMPSFGSVTIDHPDPCRSPPYRRVLLQIRILLM
jgi:hypothetical protein